MTFYSFYITANQIAQTDGASVSMSPIRNTNDDTEALEANVENNGAIGR